MPRLLLYDFGFNIIYIFSQKKKTVYRLFSICKHRLFSRPSAPGKVRESTRKLAKISRSSICKHWFSIQLLLLLSIIIILLWSNWFIVLRIFIIIITVETFLKSCTKELGSQFSPILGQLFRLNPFLPIEASSHCKLNALCVLRSWLWWKLGHKLAVQKKKSV